MEPHRHVVQIVEVGPQVVDQQGPKHRIGYRTGCIASVAALLAALGEHVSVVRIPGLFYIAGAALGALQEVAASGDNVFEALMAAVKVCSLGTISRALYEVGGQYRRNM